MPWDRSRKVPWRRLLTLYLIYAAVAAVVIIAFQPHKARSNIIGVVGGGVIYMLLLAVLVKFGYDPFRSFGRRRRGEGSTRPLHAATRKGAPPSEPAVRAKPAPTRRTSTGPNHPRPKRR